MRIAICDDSFIDRELIAELIRHYASTQTIPFDIVPYEKGMDLLYDIEDGAWFDAVLLDIYLGDTLGLALAHRLRELGYGGSIIFLTVAPEFAVDSYDVGADGYLLKPYHYEKLCRVMDRITQVRSACVYQIRQRTTVFHISYDEILYVESSNSRCILHCCTGGTYVIYKTLNEIEGELRDRRFLRCHQSFLVNMDYIRQADKQFLLVTGDVVYIRQRGLKAIRQAYLDYVASRQRPDTVP
ncbi:MAG: LytTR family DNA-binding domain-containing protein [Clostridiales bacterium]|nr:LytTR family DNA-binding domain-containing protein [Clostridiales bacterium]